MTSETTLNKESVDFLNTPPVFDFSDPTIHHDRVLVVEGRKFHVHSGILSIWSEYFKGQFSAGFSTSNTDEIKIEEVSADDFEHLLLFIYPTHAKITENNVIPLINMSHRFLVPGVLTECKNYIQENFKKVDIFELLVIAIKFAMEDLKRMIGCFIYSFPGRDESQRCKDCIFNYSDSTYCKHRDTRSTQIVVNSLVHQNRERVAKLSNEAQCYILQALVHNY